jgi:hypothetical protein
MIIKEAELDPKNMNLWKKGMLAIEQKNWEYAVSLILPVVTRQTDLSGWAHGPAPR